MSFHSLFTWWNRVLNWKARPVIGRAMLLLGLLFAQIKSHWPVRCVVNYPSCCLVSRFLQMASCCGVALTCSGCCCDPLVFPTLIMGVEYWIKVCVLPGDQGTIAVCICAVLKGTSLKDRGRRLSSVYTVFVLSKIYMNRVYFFALLGSAVAALRIYLMIELQFVIWPEVLKLILNTIVLDFLSYVVPHLKNLTEADI